MAGDAVGDGDASNRLSRGVSRWAVRWETYQTGLSGEPGA